MSIVLDSSATLAWIFADEITEAIRGVFTHVCENGAWVPGLWKLAVANILEMGVRRGRHDAAFRTSTLATLQLAERHRLTLYDASCPELALRRGLPLASLDHELRTAAQSEGVIVLGS